MFTYLTASGSIAAFKPCNVFRAEFLYVRSIEKSNGTLLLPASVLHGRIGQARVKLVHETVHEKNRWKNPYGASAGRSHCIHPSLRARQVVARILSTTSNRSLVHSRCRWWRGAETLHTIRAFLSSLVELKGRNLLKATVYYLAAAAAAVLRVLGQQQPGPRKEKPTRPREPAAAWGRKECDRRGRRGRGGRRGRRRGEEKVLKRGGKLGLRLLPQLLLPQWRGRRALGGVAAAADRGGGGGVGTHMVVFTRMHAWCFGQLGESSGSRRPTPPLRMLFH